MNAKLHFQKGKTIHFLHIGKTGGSSLIHILTSVNSDEYQIKTHGHNHGLMQLPENELFMYFLRNPIDRFISGFYSRKREGKPLYDVPWTDSERISFEEFQTPRELAEALSSNNRITYLKAIDAMNGIRHVNTHFADWLVSKEFLYKRLERLFFVGFLENFESDLLRLSDKLGVEVLPNKKLHNSPQGEEDKEMSITAIQNLNVWYSKDLELYLFHKRIKYS